MRVPGHLGASSLLSYYLSSYYPDADCIDILTILQAYRTRTSEDFRKARSAIMFSSDVTARGMDYPDVTLVVQVGMTTREQYIHRLGRTARAGKQGTGLILCAPYEAQPLKRELKDMPLVVWRCDTHRHTHAEHM